MIKNLIAICIVCPLFAISMAHGQGPFIPEDFKLFWPVPVRAHPLVPLDFRFIAYESSNDDLTWDLENEPTGMTINEEGIVSWVPSIYDEGASYNITVTVSRSSGGSISRDFTLKVDSSEFIFVSTNGDDLNSGEINSPIRNIDTALRRVKSGDGKTVLIREGTYNEVYLSGGADGAIALKDFSPNDPLVVRGYPFEKSVLDCGQIGHGLWAFQSSYVAISNLEVRNAGRAERGGIEASAVHHVVVHDTVVRGSDWANCDNVTGYKFDGSEIVVAHAIGFENFDRQNICGETNWNSSNFLIYNQTGDPNFESGDIYLLNCRSRDSFVGFKIKHEGPGRTIFHGNISYDDNIGLFSGTNYSSIRFCVCFNNKIGIRLGGDVLGYGDKAQLLEHNTIVNASHSAIQIADHYSVNEASIIKNNLLFNQTQAGTNEFQNRLMSLWIYDDFFDYLADDLDLESNNNLFFSPAHQNIIHLGGGSNGRNWNYGLGRWRNVFGLDLNSRFGDPKFADLSKGDLTIPFNSPAAHVNGSYAGAFKPGRNYPPVTDFDLPDRCEVKGNSADSIDVYASPQEIRQPSHYLFGRNGHLMSQGTIHDMASADLNGDGVDEMVLLKTDSQGRYRLEAYLAPGFDSNQLIDVGFLNTHPIVAMAAGDFNGNGTDELAFVIDRNGDHNLIIINVSEGFIFRHVVAADSWIAPAGNNCVDIAAIDLDLDGIDELAVLKQRGPNFGIYYYSVPDSGTRFSQEVGKDVWSGLMTQDITSIAGGDFVEWNPGEEIAVVVRNPSGRQVAKTFRVREGWHWSQQIASDPWFICHRYKVNKICDLKTVNETGITIWRNGRAQYPPCRE